MSKINQMEFNKAVCDCILSLAAAIEDEQGVSLPRYLEQDLEKLKMLVTVAMGTKE